MSLNTVSLTFHDTNDCMTDYCRLDCDQSLYYLHQSKFSPNCAETRYPTDSGNDARQSSGDSQRGTSDQTCGHRGGNLDSRCEHRQDLQQLITPRRKSREPLEKHQRDSKSRTLRTQSP